MASTSESDDINESSTIDPEDSTISTDDFQTTSSFVEEEDSDKSLKEDEDPEKSSVSENPTEIKEVKSSEDVDGTSPLDQDIGDATDPSFAENKLKDILEPSDDTSTFAENKLKEILEAGDDSDEEQEDAHHENAPSAEEDKISQEESEDINVECRGDSTTENIDTESSEQDISREDSEDVVNINVDEDKEDSTTENIDAESSEQDISREDIEDVVNINVDEDKEDSTTENIDAESSKQDISREDIEDVVNINVDEDKEDSTTENIDAESSKQDIRREDIEGVVYINVDEDKEDSTTETKDKENTEQNKVSERSVDGDVENGDSSGIEKKNIKMMDESSGKEEEIGDDDHVKNVDGVIMGDKHADDLVEIEKEVVSKDNLTNDDDETSAKNETKEEGSTVEDMGTMSEDVEKYTETPGLEDTVKDYVQKSIQTDNDSDRIDDVTERSANQIIDNTSADDKITDEHITNKAVKNAAGDSEDEDNATDKETNVIENFLSEAQSEIEKSIETLEVEDQEVVNDDTENDLKEVEKSAESITHSPEAAHAARSHSSSFEASVEFLKSDEQQPTEPDPDPDATESFVEVEPDPDPGPDATESFVDVELSENAEEAGDMEKYMERKADEERVLIESEQRQRTGSDQPKSESEAVKSNLKPSSVAKFANVSFSDDAETDSLHSMEESDHFKDRKKPAVPLDALRSDASSTDGSQSKSNNHRQTSYGSITSKQYLIRIN